MPTAIFLFFKYIYYFNSSLTCHLDGLVGAAREVRQARNANARALNKRKVPCLHYTCRIALLDIGNCIGFGYRIAIKFLVEL